MAHEFKVGDKVRVVDDYTVHEEGSIITLTNVNDEFVGANNEGCAWFPWHFEFVESVAPKKVSIRGGVLTIEYQGVKMTFDTSIETSRVMVDAVIDVIYDKESV